MTNGSKTWDYSYNADGLRTERTDGTNTYSYVYNGDQLAQMTINNGGTIRVLAFSYDALGLPVSMTVTSNGSSSVYYYVTNMQGDVVAILNSAGTEVVTYTYDAWGNILSIGGSFAAGIGVRNPLRYRGYVYDTETGLYYLQSRYYNPSWGRFINVDDTSQLGANGDFASYSLYAYCGNCPTFRSDSGGAFWNFVVGAVVGAALNVATQVISNAITGESWHKGVIGAAVVGGISGAIAASGLGPVAQAVWTGAVAGVNDAIQQGTEKGFDKIDVVQSARTGLAAGLTSRLGSWAGGKFFGGIDDAGQALISKGHQKAITGINRQLAGKSHTSYYRASRTLVSRGKAVVNFYRGTSSCFGSLLGVPIGIWNNLL